MKFTLSVIFSLVALITSVGVYHYHYTALNYAFTRGQTDGLKRAETICNVKLKF